MITDVFAFKDSRSYLLAALGDKSHRRGAKSQAAKFIGCHSTVISQILHGKVQINLEQADGLCRFLNLDEPRSHYLLLLVQKERAGTRSLQRYFQIQIEKFIENRRVIQGRLGQTQSISRQNEQKYYSSWVYAAIHVALSIPALRNVEALAKHFHIAPSMAQEAVDFLVKAGLATRSKEVLGVGPEHIHISNKSEQIANHHRNWRLKAIQNLELGIHSDLHYSAAVTLSREDVATIREMLLENLKSLTETIGKSKEEEVYSLSFDFFRL